MIVIDDEAEFDKLLREGTRGEVKFISILEKFYAIALGELLRSHEYARLKIANLEIVEELLQSFPITNRSLDYVTPEFLKLKPIVMFETPEFDDVYYRFDGRHRILGAVQLGRKIVPAKWVPKSMWGKYIIGREVDPVKDRGKYLPWEEQDEALPFSWKRPPKLKDNAPSYHVEPNFALFTQNNSKYDKTKSSNSGVMNLFNNNNTIRAK